MARTRNGRQSGDIRFPPSEGGSSPVVVRPMTEEERQKYGLPAPRETRDDIADIPLRADGIHINPAIREAIKQDLLAYVGRRTIQEKYGVPAQLVSYYAVQLQKEGKLGRPSGLPRARRSRNSAGKGEEEAMGRQGRPLGAETIATIEQEITVNGLSHQEIADKYGISKSTVSHYARMMGKKTPPESEKPSAVSANAAVGWGHAATLIDRWMQKAVESAYDAYCKAREQAEQWERLKAFMEQTPLLHTPKQDPQNGEGMPKG